MDADDGAMDSSESMQGQYTAITHAEEYQGMSFEELRLRDYARMIMDMELAIGADPVSRQMRAGLESG